jgi:hypothetical protein
MELIADWRSCATPANDDNAASDAAIIASLVVRVPFMLTFAVLLITADIERVDQHAHVVDVRRCRDSNQCVVWIR